MADGCSYPDVGVQNRVKEGHEILPKMLWCKTIVLSLSALIT
jgi:hypothetical protein